MIRLATIGTSTITRHFAEAVHAVDGIRISSAYSRDPQRAADLARVLGADMSASSLEQLLRSPDNDAVYVGSPNSVHHDQALAALRAGKHVLVEKPAVPTATQWVQLVEQAREAGVVLLEGIRNEYDPGIRAVREILPKVGRIRRVSLRYQKRSARYDQVLAGQMINIFDPAMAGGALMDLGVYCVHAMITLFGPPHHVTGVSILVASGVDGAGAILAEYPGLVVDLSYSKITTSTLPSEIQGEDATLLIDHVASPRTLTLQRRGGRIEHRVLTEPQHTLVDEVRRFVDLIQTASDPTTDHENTRQTLQVMDAIESLSGDSVIDLADPSG
jgi:predicted dehydrogenase